MAVSEKNRITDGFRSLERGMNSGISPALLPRNQCSFSINTTMRGGFPRTRPKFLKLTLSFPSMADDDVTFFKTQNFQGEDYYVPPQANDDECLICSIGGRIYRINILGMTGTVMEITDPADRNPPNIDKAYFLMAEQYFLIRDGSSKTLIYDGATMRRATADEIPPGKSMAYGLGRIWFSTHDRMFQAGDIYGGLTGILKVTENNYINGGGSFVVPLQSGEITAMLFTAQIDTSTGQGQLLVCTANAIYSVNVPIDRSLWPFLTDPIQTIALIKFGAMSNRSAILVNGDTYFRRIDGIGSLIIARRDFFSYGNTPISSEMDRIILNDDTRLLQFSSAVLWDNRVLMTCSPVFLPYSCYHRGLIALDFNLISSMASKAPPAYDGIWTGLNFQQLTVGRFAGADRCFSAVRSAAGEFELWEITKDYGDDNNATRIACVVETGSYDFPSFGALGGSVPNFSSIKRLETSDIWQDEIRGPVDWAIRFKPDQYPGWVDWHSWTECASAKNCLPTPPYLRPAGTYAMGPHGVNEITLDGLLTPGVTYHWFKNFLLGQGTSVVSGATTLTNPGNFIMVAGAYITGTPGWVPSVFLDAETCNTLNVCREQYRPRITLPQPTDDCEPVVLKPFRMGYEFQFRLEWTGQCRVKLFHPHCLLQQELPYLECPTEETCQCVSVCNPDPFAYKSE